MQNSDTQFGDNQQDREILALLKDYPAPLANDEFFNRALVRATHEGTRRQRNRWLMTGFGGAVAAGLVMWMLGGLYFNTPDLPVADPGLPSVTMTLEEPRTINLVFASNEALQDATLTVMLPPGVEMAAFPGQREISWQTSLNAGKNLLPLKLIAVSPMGGEVHGNPET